jgi:lipoate-protein ligase A
MKRLEITLPTPEENVALDEALLDAAEERGGPDECVRLWESPEPIVVVGRSSRIGAEVDEAACERRGVRVVRRSSGGAAIVAGPGCLMYAVVLSHETRPELKDIGRAHGYVLDRMATALESRLPSAGRIMRAGTSDLVFIEERTERGPARLRKFSGNSMRMKRSHLLYHGTLLYDFDLALVEEVIKMPPRQPDYRDERSHADFIMNVPMARPRLVEAVREAWESEENFEWPRGRVAELVEERFSCAGWTREFE